MVWWVVVVVRADGGISAGGGGGGPGCLVVVAKLGAWSRVQSGLAVLTVVKRDGGGDTYGYEVGALLGVFRGKACR